MKIVETTEKIEQTGLAQGVKDLGATSLGTHDADATQNGEVVRHRGNVQLHQRGQVCHAMLAFCKRTDNPHPRRIAQRFENFRHTLEVLSILRQFGLARAHAWDILPFCQISKKKMP